MLWWKGQSVGFLCGVHPTGWVQAPTPRRAAASPTHPALSFSTALTMTPPHPSSHSVFLLRGPDPTPPTPSPLWHRLNLHSYKYSGLANLTSTVDVAPVEGGVAISKSSSKSKAGKLGQTIVKKNARRTNYAAGAVAASVRPDLKRAAQARASALTKAARTAKAAKAASA